MNEHTNFRSLFRKKVSFSIILLTILFIFSNCKKESEGPIGACPTGWHLPTDNEWKTLEMHIGMSQSEADKTGLRGTDEGKKMKSTTGWNSCGNGTDEVSFMALPGDHRVNYGSFDGLGSNGRWWSATEYSSTIACYRYLDYDSDGVYRNHPFKVYSYSVRCVRD